MALIIGVVLLLALAYLIYDAGQKAFHREHVTRTARNTAPEPEAVAESIAFDRLWRAVIAVNTDPPPDDEALTREETQEANLTRQLLAGSLEPSIYRRLMAELAHGEVPRRSP